MENKFTETFDIEKFIPDAKFEDVINRFENGRTIKDFKYKNPVLSIEEMKKETEESKIKKEP